MLGFLGDRVFLVVGDFTGDFLDFFWARDFAGGEGGRACLGGLD